MTTKALENAARAAGALMTFLAEPVISDRDRAGVIQAFELTFEAVWKLLEHVAEREGLAAESPRRALIAGYQLGLIDDEALWLEMMSDRNLPSHVDHHQVAARIFAKVSTQYSEALTTAIRLARSALTET
jgi:nucleotidyltransferase substrate binding protein (TIGR01987 family)